MSETMIRKNHMDVLWHEYTDKEGQNLPIVQASLTEKASIIGRAGIMLLSCGTGAWRVRSSMNTLAEVMGVTCTADIGLMSIEYTCFDGQDGFTQSLCLTNTGVNTSKLNRLEHFIQDFETEGKDMSGEQLHNLLDNIEEIHGLYSPIALGIAAALACGGFTFLLGGGPIEMFCAFVGAGLGNFLRCKLTKHHYTLFLGIVLSVSLACLSYAGLLKLGEIFLGLSVKHEAGYICAMLFIIPGFPFITSGIDLAKLDMRSGIERLGYALIIILVATMSAWIMHLHTHDSTGNGVSTVLMAAEAGVDIVDLAIESMSSMTSQPSMNAVAEALRGTKRDTGLDFEELSELSRYYNRIRSVYAPFESDMKSPNTEIYKYEIPGGQYSNLLAQVTEMGSPEEFEAIKGLYKEANDLLGNIVKVTPTSKAVGDLAIFMYKNNLNKDNILTAGASLSYPDSVVSYFQGMMGQPYGGFPKKLQKIVLKDIEPLTERPGKLLPPEDLEGIKKHLIEKYHYEDKSEEVMAQKAISYALYPKVYEDYCEHFEMYNDVTRLESHVYFYGLRKGEETYLKIGEGKELLIKYLEQSDPDENGIRTLSFQVNGSIRTVKIQDHNLEIKTDRRLKADKNNPQHLGSSIPGTVDKVLVKEGDVVTKNMPLMTIEAMKMETTVVSTVNGTVDKIYVEAGDSVHQDDLLVSFHIKE